MSLSSSFNRHDNSRLSEHGAQPGSGTGNGTIANGHSVHGQNSGPTASKSLPTTPKHRSSARVEFQTEFPEHCQLFDGHMKVQKQFN